MYLLILLSIPHSSIQPLSHSLLPHSIHPATYPFILPFTPTTSVIHSHIFPLTHSSDTCFLIHPSIHPVTHPSKPLVPALSPLVWITGSEVESPYLLCSYFPSFHSCSQDGISESITPSHPWPRAKASLGCDLNASSFNSPVPRLAFCALDTVSLSGLCTPLLPEDLCTCCPSSWKALLALVLKPTLNYHPDYGLTVLPSEVLS